MKELFIQFLTEWLEWAEKNAELGFPVDDCFTSRTGLCSNWLRWCRIMKGYTHATGDLDVAEEFLKEEFISTGVCEPDGDHFKWYCSENITGSHRWEPRLKWVREYLAKNVKD